MHVDHGLTQLAAGARHERARIQAVAAHEGQRDDGGGKHSGVNQEDRAHPPPVDEETRRGRTNEARSMESGRVEGDSVRHLVLRHELAHEGLARRGIDGGDSPRNEGQDVLVPELARPRQYNDADDEGDEADPRLRALQEAAPGDAIREDPRPRRKQDDRQELQGGDHADLRGVVIGEDRQHVPILGDALKPRAGRGNQGGDEPIPIVHVAHGRECCRHADPPSLTAVARTERGHGTRRRSSFLGVSSQDTTAPPEEGSGGAGRV